MRIKDELNYTLFAAIGGAAILLFLTVFVWFFCRLEPKGNQFAILIRKTGKTAPFGTVIAKQDEKGIQLDILPPGRYFYNPFSWGWEIKENTNIPAGKLGVLTRLYGNASEPGEVVATATSRGIIRDVLPPGTHRINPYAYDLDIFDAQSVKPGHIGVQVSLTGKDPLSGNNKNINSFVMAEGTKGMSQVLLQPGTFYVNPYLVSIIEYNVQSQRFEMSGVEAIDFLTIDGFQIKVEGTVEYAIKRELVPKLAQQVGDMDDIIHKIILPNVRGFARIEGSKSPALNYIVGEMRQKFQDQLEIHLKKVCIEWGIEVRNVLIRNISPPDDISKVIRERELAKQTRLAYKQQIDAAKSKTNLVEKEKMAEQNTEKVTANTTKIQAKILAEQEQSVALTAANQRLAVAMTEKEAAESLAAAIISQAEGRKQVISLQNTAESQVLASQSEAFGGGFEYARYLFMQQVAPKIDSIMTSDQSGLGAIFNQYLK